MNTRLAGDKPLALARAVVRAARTEATELAGAGVAAVVRQRGGGLFGKAHFASVPEPALREILDSLPVGVAVLAAPDFLYTYANRAFRAVIPDRTVLGKSFLEVWGRDAEDYRPLLEKVLETGEPARLSDVCIPASFSHADADRYFTIDLRRIEIGEERALLVRMIDTTKEVEARTEVSRLEQAVVREPSVGDLFEGIADGFITLDREWRFTYLNRRAEELLHNRRENLLGRVIWKVMPQAEGSPFEDAFVRAKEEDRAITFEQYYPPLDMWASVHVVPSPIGLTVYLSDITSRKRAESALAQSEGQLRALIDNSPDVVYMKDLEGTYVRVNQRWRELHGLSPNEAGGKRDSDLWPDEYAHEIRENDLRVLEAGEPMSFEEEVPDARGRMHTYISSKFPLKDVSGNVYGLAGISTDITERKRQEMALAYSEERFRRIFDEAPLGMATADEHFRFVRVNDRFAEMLGYTKEELVGMSFEDVTASEQEADREPSRAAARALLAERIPRYQIEKRYRRKDGTVFEASLTGALIREDGKKTILGMVEDITGRKRAEAALREKDRAIRRAYTDVIAAVTGGKLVLMMPDEMAEALGDMISESWPIDEYVQFSEVRRKLAEALREAGLDPEKTDSYVLAASEAFTNAVKHAGRGEVRVRRSESAIQIEVTDHGKGIDFDNLPKATLLAGFSTTQTLGMGFSIMLDICDRVLLTTQRGLTTVVLESAVR